MQPLVSSFGKSSSSLTANKAGSYPKKKSKNASIQAEAPLWLVPESAYRENYTFRSVKKYENCSKKKQIYQRMNEGVVAQIVTDDLLQHAI
jgi:hypothetical protein